MGIEEFFKVAYKVIITSLFVVVLVVIIKTKTITREGSISIANSIQKEKQFCSTLERKFIDKEHSSSRRYVFKNGYTLILENSAFKKLYDILEVGDSACKELDSLNMRIIKGDTTLIYSLDYRYQR